MESLLDRLRRRDPAAFQEAMTRYGPPLLNTLEHLLHDRAEAEDLVQEAFARLFLNVDSVRALRAWLFQVGMNLARTRLRRRAIPPPEPAAAPGRGDPELRAGIDAALEALPERTRVAFLLREVAGLTTAEVADAEGCSPDAVRQRICEARRKLRESLAPFLQRSLI